MIISISGRFRSGKDTVYNLLSQKISIERMAFADTLKNSCSEAFGIDNRYFFEDDLKDKAFNIPFVLTQDELVSLSEVCNFSTNPNYFNVGEGKILRSPREILQFVGTDLIRKTIDNNFWLNYLVEKVEKANDVKHLAVTDSRFGNERRRLKEVGAKLVLVTRPCDNELAGGSHSSENDLGKPEEYDYIINNDGTIEELDAKIRAFALEFM